MDEEPSKIFKELKSIKNKLKHTYRTKICRYCGYKNPHDYIYCKKCSMPLTTDEEEIKEWLLEKYLLQIIENISDYPDIVAARRKIKIGKVEFDYDIELADNRKILIYIERGEENIADIINEVMDYSNVNGEKIRIVFLRLLVHREQNNNYDIDIKYFDI